MSIFIMLGVASILGYIHEQTTYFVKVTVQKHKMLKARGRRSDWKTRIKYKLEDCWDFLITPR